MVEKDTDNLEIENTTDIKQSWWLLGEVIQEETLEKQMKQSYIEYAMTVIVSRALPDTRDWLKPVIRRILFAMFDMKNFYNSKHKKSARLVWEVLWKYHPHGDSSVYEAMVRLAQPWSLRYPLVDWQGNFWSIDWDWAAAMRYTEAKMSKIAQEMLADLHLDTVDWRGNFDWSIDEPVVLPTKFPNHLCNGTMWIAVWMATNMPPHNLVEVIDACLLLISKDGKPITEEQKEAFLQKETKRYKALFDSKELEREENRSDEMWEFVPQEFVMPHVQAPATYSVSIDEIMEIIKWPDLPTGWYIFDSENIKEVYKKWKWWIVMRGKTHIEDNKNDGKIIVIDEIPYQVNKANLVAKIWWLVVDKKLEWIEDVRDESSQDKIRITLYVKKSASAEKLLVLLYKMTELQCNFNVNNVTLVEWWIQPKLLNIKDMLVEFVTFRRKVVFRRSNFLLSKAQDRLHILEWLKKAIDIIDEVIATIRASNTKQEAKDDLMKKFDFSDSQAEHILMMRLQSLVWLEMQKVTDEIAEKKAEIEYLEWIVNDAEKLDGVVIEEMNYMKDTYGDKRRTQVINDDSVYKLSTSLKDLLKKADMVKEDCILWMSHDYTLRLLYQTRVLNIPDDTLDLVYTHNQDRLIVITNTWELYVERLKDFWAMKTSDKALGIKKHFWLKWEIVFAKTLHFDYDYLCLLTSSNNIKKINKKDILWFKKFPTSIMNLVDKWEKIISIVPVTKTSKLWVLTKKWCLLLFQQKDVRPMWKNSWGVNAIDLEDGDAVTSLFLYNDEPFIFIHSQKEWKLLNVEDLRVWKRAKRWDIVASNLWKNYLVWALSIEEWAVTFKHEDDELTTLHSNDINLDVPNSPLAPVSKKVIKDVFRPREEKSENSSYKDNRPEDTDDEESQSDWLFVQ